MEHNEQAETQPYTVGNQNEVDQTVTAAEQTEAESMTRRRPWRWLILLSLGALLMIAAASAFGGYQSGIQLRTSHEATQVSGEVAAQFELGLADLEAGRYDVARQRFEYVIRLDPNYPGVIEALSAVLLHLNTTATPTPVATPTLTPTADLRGAEELFSQAQATLAARDWTGAIDILQRLRKAEPAYKAVEVDSMLYVALRNRGVDRILKEADLEGGTYDLALAERFGPLDVEARNYRTWADLYVTGASFWELDWSQAVYYFEQIIMVAPNLRDKSNITATERYRTALIGWGDFLAVNGEPCLAVEKYEQAFQLAEDPSVQPTATWAMEECERGDKDKDKDKDDGDDEQPTEVTPPPTDAGGYPTPPPGETPTPEPTTSGYPAP